MVSRIISEILTYSQETKTLIALRKENSDGVWVGYIVEFNDSVFVLQHISSLGLEDGLVIERIDNVDSFETDDDYLKGVQLLFDQAGQIPKQAIKNIDISSEENWQHELLKSGFDQGKLITVEINNSETINYGFVLDFDDSLLQLKSVTKTGDENGTETYSLSNITSLTVDRIEGRKRQFLYDMKKKKRISRKGKN